jgi:cytochrome P450
MMAHSEGTRDMLEMEFVGNLALLIVGGNDTTRNSMSGGLLALSQNPAELAKLKANPQLVPSLVAETIRYQTPVIHMRRTATRDAELDGQRIRQGDKVVMWYVSRQPRRERDREARLLYCRPSQAAATPLLWRRDSPLCR